MSSRRLWRRLLHLEHQHPVLEVGDSGPWEWYAEGCPCGLPAGDCTVHPRATIKQRPPEGDWRTWLILAGRGFGKTRSAAEWVRQRVESGRARHVALVGATAADVRDVMVEGKSGILAVCPEWDRPRYEPSKRRLTWPNGARATTFSADEPNRLRGPEHDCAWGDEVAAWTDPLALDNLLLGLRIGDDPRLCITTTPKPTKMVRELSAEPGVVVSKGSTYDNRKHLAPRFFDQVISKYEGTRLGLQEIHAQILEVADGAWFPTFSRAKHVTPAAEYDPRLRVHLAIDCGVSRHVGAVWFQVLELDQFKRRVNVFGDIHIEGLFSAAAAEAIRRKTDELPCRGRLDTVRVDPAANARTGVGPTAFSEFQRVFGLILDRWPTHGVLDGLDQVEVLLESGCLIIHERCAELISAFANYARAKRGGEWSDEPADPQHPHEDLMDALRGGIRDRMPEGRIEQGSGLRTTRASRLF